MTRGEELVYGQHAVAAVLADDLQRIREVWLQRGRDTRLAGELTRRLADSPIPVHSLARAQLDALFPDARHQGVVIRARARAGLDLKGLMAQLGGRDAPLVVVLDGIEDPHNLGSILRTADAAGVDAVVVPRSRGVGLTASVRKVASGAAETVPLVQVPNLARALEAFAVAGLHIVGTDMAGENVVFDADLRGPLVLVLGSEGQGLRALTARHCDERVRLPMRGKVGSLNVAVAAGVCLFEALRQRHTLVRD